MKVERLKRIKFVYECRFCGTEKIVSEILKIGECIQKHQSILILPPIGNCICGERKFKLVDISLNEDVTYLNKSKGIPFKKK